MQFIFKIRHGVKLPKTLRTHILEMVGARKLKFSRFSCFSDEIKWWRFNNNWRGGGWGGWGGCSIVTASFFATGRNFTWGFACSGFNNCCMSHMYICLLLLTYAWLTRLLIFSLWFSKVFKIFLVLIILYCLKTYCYIFDV